MPGFWVSLFSEPISFLEISWKIPQEPNPCWLAFNMAQWGRSAMDIDWGVIMYRKEYVQFTTMIIPCLSHQNPLMFHPHSILLMVIFHSMRLSLKILENLAKSMCKLVKICQNPSNSYWFSHHCPTRISIIIPSLSIIFPWKNLPNRSASPAVTFLLGLGVTADQGGSVASHAEHNSQHFQDLFEFRPEVHRRKIADSNMIFILR